VSRQEVFAWLSSESSRVIHFTRHFSRFGAEKHYGDLSRHYRGSSGSDYHLNVMTREEIEKELIDYYDIDWKARTFSPKTRKEERRKCERCGEELHPDRLVWLEFDQRTSTYTNQDVPEKYSQGGFTFGAACAKRELARHHVAERKRRRE
jgi:hypothetical protein